MMRLTTTTTTSSAGDVEEEEEGGVTMTMMTTQTQQQQQQQQQKKKSSNNSNNNNNSSHYYGSIPEITMYSDDDDDTAADDGFPRRARSTNWTSSSNPTIKMILVAAVASAILGLMANMMFFGTAPSPAMIAAGGSFSSHHHHDHSSHGHNDDHNNKNKSSKGKSSKSKSSKGKSSKGKSSKGKSKSKSSKSKGKSKSKSSKSKSSKSKSSKSSKSSRPTTDISDILLDPKYDSKELFYDEQYVDHIYVDTEHGDDNKKGNKGDKHKNNNLPTYSQRYYKKSKYWAGPGSPILVILGGEDALDLPMLYPFVHEGLASQLRAFTLSPEHRFYGKSQPIKNPDIPSDLIKYLTPDQALLDTVNLVQYTREKLGCSLDRSSAKYCPVITFGGSYPGFLSAMMRFRFPDIIDIGYASSAPLELYSQVVDSNAYYDKVTEVADIASPGCSDAVRQTLYSVRDALLVDEDDTTPGYSPTDVKDAASSIGVCPDTLPKYISEYNDVYTLVSEAVVYLIPAIFADFNMAYYPPTDQSALSKACAIFQQDDKTPFDKMKEFYNLRNEVEYGGGEDNDDKDDKKKKGKKSDKKKQPKCFDLNLELPSGKHARIMGADWSGSGGGFTGEVWEFQCCKDLIIRAGYSHQSMFIDRQWSYFWHQEHCHIRFPGIPVDPFRMVNEWHFDNILNTGSKILFANGLNDGWSTSSILDLGSSNTNNTDLAVITFPNGAHHSELSQVWPNKNDTPDILAGYDSIATILLKWLNEISSGSTTTISTSE